ncbi:hypothetical protein PR202_ga13347 [Eleusine coracana subsp. coracana]|uniref:SCP domain-containing protein n=1 Tax=Eleusine coracana subsp. coracana TaxID=191504 RepID=A0AAV5CEG4_ELECO|nr:hypothetical protein PR202_ga13347 [Eleusine coracana subsp. coracana]
MAAASLLVLLLALGAAPAHAARHSGLGRQRAPATNSSSTSNATTASEYLAPHNQARAAVGVPPLRWSADLASGGGGEGDGPAAAGGVRVRRHGREPVRHEPGVGELPRPAGGGGGVVGGAGEVLQPRQQHVRRGKAVRDVHAGGVAVACRRSGARRPRAPRAPPLTLCLYNPHGNVQGQSPILGRG